MNEQFFRSNALPIVKVIGTVHPENYLSRGLIKNIGITFDKFQERFGNPRLWFSLNVHEQKNNIKMPDISTKHFWQAKAYHHHSTVQSEAAHKLLYCIEFIGHEKVLDVGCGDGKITATIARRVSTGSVLGIDASKEMIDFAQTKYPQKQYQNLTFLVQDAQQLNYVEEFDIVFSSFALQWVLDHNSFLKAAYDSIKPIGYLAVTIPLGISFALEQAISELISQVQWSPYFHNFSKSWHFSSEKKFVQLLTNNQFEIVQQAVVSQESIFYFKTRL